MNLLALIGLLTVLYWFARSRYSVKARKLRKIPSVGNTLPLFSLLNTFKFVKNTHSLVEIGIRKWPGRIFKIPALTDWWVIVTDPKLMDEVQKAPDHILSATEGQDELFQLRLTIGPQVISNPYHVAITRGQFTRALPKLIPDIHDETVNSLNQYFPVTDDWSSIKVLENIMKIVAHASNRVFLGTSLCRDPDWINLNINFTRVSTETALFIRLLPTFLRPFFLTRVSKYHRDALRLMEPIITARRKQRMEGGDNYPEKPQDVLTWLMDEAKGEEASDAFLVARLVLMNVGAIFTTSMTITQALFDLVTFPEYIQPLREEVEAITTQEGWTKEALDHMHRVDSFIKESQRLHPVGTLNLGRMAMTDFTFSDGTEIGAGTLLFVSAPFAQLHPGVYEDPLKFDGFRFIKMKERAVLEGYPNKKFDIVSTSLDSLPFGHGRHACPGRFFAAIELKLILALVLVTYDVKLAGTGVRPSDTVFMQSVTPDPSAKLHFRRRKIEVY